MKSVDVTSGNETYQEKSEKKKLIKNNVLNASTKLV